MRTRSSRVAALSAASQSVPPTQRQATAVFGLQRGFAALGPRQWSDRPTLVSVINDVIGAAMRGPSSSHRAAAVRAGRLVRDLKDGDMRDALVEYNRQGPLPATQASQGSDMGMFGGPLGWDAAGEGLPHSASGLRESGAQSSIDIVDAGDPHPNTYPLNLASARQRHGLWTVPAGGGMIDVTTVDGVAVSVFGDCFETLLWSKAVDAAVAVSCDADAVVVHRCGAGAVVEAKGSRSLATRS